MGPELKKRLESRRLDRSFYARSHTEVARDLLGKILWHSSPGGDVAVRIVETEAYGGGDDPGSHGYRGKTRRNATMFGPPGHLYVYFTYGMHYCLNVVTGASGESSAVLIRAGEPLWGTELMAKRRGVSDIYNLASGPAKLAQALGVERSFDGVDLCASSIGIFDDDYLPWAVVQATRVGLSRDGGHLWRFCIEDNRFVSKPWPWRAASRD